MACCSNASLRLLRISARASFSMVLAAMFGCQPLSIDVGDSHILLRDGDCSLLDYRYADVPFKPYVQQWWSPNGVSILRDAPHDHLHHHALMFAVNVDGVEFWGEAAKSSPGRQAHRGFDEIKANRSAPVPGAGFVERVEWLVPGDEKVMLREKRSIEAYRSGDLGASLMTWRMCLSPPEGKDAVTLTGREYFGLGMRFIQSMDRTGQFVNSSGKTGLAGTNDAQARWTAYTAEADGATVTVAVFDHPANPRHPARWFTMLDPFAYITATPGLHHEPMTIQAGQNLRLCYGLALWDGAVESGAIESIYERWLGLVGE